MEGVWRAVDLGWGDAAGGLTCHARVVLPLQGILTRICCCGDELRTDWRRVTVSLVLGDSPLQGILLRCTPVDHGSATVTVALSQVSGLCRLGGVSPGLELRTSSRRSRLQLLALESGEGSASPRFASEFAERFQLLHAYLAAVAEVYSEMYITQSRGDSSVEMIRASPLEWPDERGGNTSVASSAILRRIKFCPADEISSRARYAGQSCQVCLERWVEFGPEQRVAPLHCGHAFCEPCLEKLLGRGYAICPSCRVHLGPNSSAFSLGSGNQRGES